MKKAFNPGWMFIAALACMFVSTGGTCSLRAQQIIVNELYNSSSTDEWVELLVLHDSLDLRGFDLRDFSGTGTAQQPLTFTTNALWSSLRKGTIILVGTASTTFTEDTDPSDYLLVIK